LAKPFEFEELSALIEANLRPAKNSAPVPQSAVPPLLKEHLTTTERSVLTYVAMGMLNKEIAKKMCISTRTVESHVRNLLQKTALANRTALARWAMDMQLV
jgi:DNA-binding NarL/FixJ family response regulator